MLNSSSSFAACAQLWARARKNLCPSLPQLPRSGHTPGRFVPNLPPAKSATAAHEGKPRAASNPAQWLPLSKAVPARRFFRGGARKTPDFPLISTLRRKIFAAARLSSWRAAKAAVAADDRRLSMMWPAGGLRQGTWATPGPMTRCCAPPGDRDHAPTRVKLAKRAGGWLAAALPRRQSMW